MTGGGGVEGDVMERDTAMVVKVKRYGVEEEGPRMQQQQQQQPSVVMYSGRGESCSMEGRIGGGGRVTEAYRMTSSGFLRRSSIEHIA